MTDLTANTARPGIEPGAALRFAAAVVASHRWAHAVLRHYNRVGPSGLPFETDSLETGFARD